MAYYRVPESGGTLFKPPAWGLNSSGWADDLGYSPPQFTISINSPAVGTASGSATAIGASLSSGGSFGTAFGTSTAVGVANSFASFGAGTSAGSSNAFAISSRIVVTVWGDNITTPGSWTPVSNSSGSWTDN